MIKHCYNCQHKMTDEAYTGYMTYCEIHHEEIEILDYEEKTENCISHKFIQSLLEDEEKINFVEIWEDELPW